MSSLSLANNFEFIFFNLNWLWIIFAETEDPHLDEDVDIWEIVYKVIASFKYSHFQDNKNWNKKIY